jgi:beta-glucosidase
VAFRDDMGWRWVGRAFALGCGILALGPSAISAAEAPATIHPESWPALPPKLLIRPRVESFVDELLAQMTLEEKIGQMIQADIGSITPDDLRHYKLGSILAGGNAAPGNDVHAPAKDWLSLADAFYQVSIEAGSAPHRPIPVLFGIDAVHGDAKIRGATIFPHNVGLGAAHDPALLEQIGRATAEEVSVTGLDWTFAPTLAVVRDPRWGRSYESYSEDPTLVARYAGAMVAGLQGRLGTDDFVAPGHTLASAKHFLGDGGTVDGRDQGDNLASEAELRRIHAAGYPPAIEAGAMIVMASYNSWHGVKMHGNDGLLTGVLKGRFGFDGFVVGDWNAQEENPGCTKFSCPAAILAGIDMLMAPDSWRELYDNTLRQAQSGAIPAARIDDAVRRILRVKALSGLFDHPAPSARKLAGHAELLGSPEHRALARQAVRESLVLLKNQAGLLPLDPHGRILVAGDGADDIGRQSGGWTIDWQGDHNHNTDFPGGTSIFAGIKAAVEAAGGTASLSPDGSFAERPDTAIVVFGEAPYAEFQGDRETLDFAPGDRHAFDLLKRLQARKIPTIAVFLSGRPLWVNPELNAADAFVAAWLPGSEGGGVADVLFRDPDGKPMHDFTGKLAFSWPRTAMPVVLDAQDQPQNPLFPRGFGLSYADHASLPHLSEDPQIPADRRATGTLLHAGHVTAPWSIYVGDALADVRLTTTRQPSPAGAVTIDLVGGKPGLARITWTGTGTGAAKITGRATDLRPFAWGGSAVSFRYRIDQAPTAPVTIELGCGKACRGSVDISKQLRAAPAGHWQILNIALSCFATEGADLSAIDMPFAIASSGRFSLTLSEVKLVPGAGASSCGSKQG